MNLPLSRRSASRQAATTAVELLPVAVVRNGVRKPRPHGWADLESRIELLERLGPETLAGLDGFSHVLIIFWMHALADDRPRPALLRVGTDPTQRGIFATRSQLRPNQIGCSAVPLLSVRGRELRVRGLDAIDGTPVLDLKPYIPYYDSVAAAAVPDWVYGGA